MSILHRVFVASPSDVEAERQVARRVVNDLNGALKELGRNQQLHFLAWEDLHPDVGNPQQVVLDQAVLKKCDIFIAILWKRFGRPPDGARPTDGQPYLSGTQREIDEAMKARRASKNGRPVIMIYRKIDPLPGEMSDEEFRQLAKVRGYLREFEPDGKHPALISKVLADQFETILRRDLLQVLGEFQQAEVQAVTPPSTSSASNRNVTVGDDAARNIIVTGDNTQITLVQPGAQPPPTTAAISALNAAALDIDYLTDWLRAVGLRGHPFEQNRAEEERALPRYFVSPSGVRVQGLANPPKPTIIFGSAGSGKTALRTMVAAACYPQRPESDTLCIPFGRRELESVVVGAPDTLSTLTPVDFAIPLARLILDQLKIHASGVLDKRLPEFEWVYNPALRGPLARWLETLADVIAMAGFKRVLYLVDQIDELHAVQNKPELMADILEPLMTLELREARNLAFAYFLPESIVSQLTSRNQIFRLDRCDIYYLRWTDDMLRRLIRQRMVYHSANLSAPYSSLGQLCDGGLAETIDNELIGLAAGNPRALLWLASRLIQQHCDGDDPPPLIRQKTWASVKDSWWLEGRPLFFPAVVFWMWQDRVFFHAREVVLAGLSQSLLVCLTRAEGRVCDRLELAQAGWPTDRPDGVSQRAIDEAIRRLKIDLRKAGLDSRWIQTVRGRGFRLAAPDQTGQSTEDREEELDYAH